MFRSFKLALTALMVGTGVFATGCTSNSPQSSLEPSQQGLTCSKCQVTLVQVPTSNGKRIVGYTWAKKDTCPDCMDAIQSFVNTGKFEHNCKTCGDTMSICEAHPAK